MTGQQFKEVRNKMGFTQSRLSTEWNMGKNGARTIRRWESGDIPVNPIAAYCIDLMLHSTPKQYVLTKKTDQKS